MNAPGSRGLPKRRAAVVGADVVVGEIAGRAAEELSKLALDERGKPVTVGTRSDLGEEGFEVIAHDAVQQALLARAGRVSEPKH